MPYVKYHVIIEALPLIKERNRPYVIAGFWNDPGSLDVTTLPDGMIMLSWWRGGVGGGGGGVMIRLSKDWGYGKII